MTGKGILPAAAALLIALWPASVRGADALIIVQRSPLAGFRHYEAPLLWRQLGHGDKLALVREPGNPHDSSAVRVTWQRMVGLLPRP